MANLEFWIWMRKVFIILFSPLGSLSRRTLSHIQTLAGTRFRKWDHRASPGCRGRRWAGVDAAAGGLSGGPGPPQLQRLEVSIFVSSPHFKILTTDTHLFLNLGPQKCAHSLTVVCHLLVYDLWWGCSVVSWTTCLTPGCFVETLKQRKTF